MTVSLWSASDKAENFTSGATGLKINFQIISQFHGLSSKFDGDIKQSFQSFAALLLAYIALYIY